jgi:hypothetical protein
MCIVFLLQAILFLTAVGSVIAQYHVYEYGEGQQNGGHDSSLSSAGSSAGGRHEVYSAEPYLTPHATSYGEPVRNSYSDPTSYYEAGDHSGASYDGGPWNEDHRRPGRVKIRVSSERREV